MSKRKFAKVDSEEMILNKCPLCNGELEYYSLGQYSDVYKILKNGKISKRKKRRQVDGSLECGFIKCTCCDFVTDCDLDVIDYNNIHIYESNIGEFKYEIDDLED